MYGAITDKKVISYVLINAYTISIIDQNFLNVGISNRWVSSADSINGKYFPCILRL